MVMNSLAGSAASYNPASTVFAILASAVIVLGGLAALVRAIWKIAVSLRDNTVAIRKLTERLEEYTKSSDSRIDRLTERISRIERQQNPDHKPQEERL